ncbi:hypothetical protein ACTMU2_38445 [Cupriavidus basilensis]
MTALGKISAQAAIKETRSRQLSDAPFTPYCVPAPAEHVAALLSEIQAITKTLAVAERWSDSHLSRVLETLKRQPAFTLPNEIAYFRNRLHAIQAMERTSKLLANTCGSVATLEAAHPLADETRTIKTRIRRAFKEVMKWPL